MNPKRKATTYGKSSRKPISGFFSAATDAFAQALEPRTVQAGQDEMLTQNYRAPKLLRHDGVHKKPAAQSVAPKSLAKSREFISQSQNQSDTAPSSARQADQVYDFSSTDEETGRRTSISDAGSIKRRKLTPKLTDPPELLVYDDDSLQRHIAAEIQTTLVKKASGKPKATDSPIPPLPHTSHTSDDLKYHDTSLIQGRAPCADKQARLQGVTKKTMQTAKVAGGKPTAPAKNRTQRPSSSKSPPRKPSPAIKCPIQTVQNSSILPKAFKTLSARPSSDRVSDAAPEKEHSYSHSTPLRRSSSTGMATTSRQRELWSKLLSDDVRSASPNRLDLPSLSIADQKDRSRNLSSNVSHVQNRTEAGFAEPTKRSRRLVDFLVTSSGGKGSNEELCSSDDDESSIADLSKSVRSDISMNDGILTTQTSPSAESQSKRPQPPECGLSSVSQPISSLQGGLKVTYARQRSYRTDNDNTDTAIFDIQVVPEVSRADISYRDRFGGSSYDTLAPELDDAQDSQGGAMRSIHELREAGGNTRLAGELETMLDDLDEQQDKSVSTRRSNLMSLTSKLLEPSICRLFVDQGLESRLLAQVNVSHDVIERSLLAASILQILFHTTSNAFLSQINQARTKNLLIGLLTSDQDLTKRAKLRETNMSKLAQSEYVNICHSLLKLPVWQVLKPPMLSGQVLALQCLEFLVRRAREAGSFAEILSADAIGCIAETSIQFSGPLQPPISYPTICLELAVSILESSTINGAAENRECEWTERTHQHIRDILPLLTESRADDWGHLETLTLRLYLNLTNANPHLCEVFSKPPLISAIFKKMLLHFARLAEPDSQTKDVHPLDNLVLSLGCLINLAESCDTMRRLVADSRNQDGTFLDTLLQLFTKKRKKAAEAYSEEEAGSNVAYGYVAVLLCYLCINGTVKSKVSAQLESGTLKELLNAVEEFLHYHRQIDDGSQQERGSEDCRTNFIGRLQSTVDGLR